VTRSAAQLAQRRADLLARSDRLRNDLAESLSTLAARLRYVDTAATLLRGAGGPLVVSAALALLLFRGPRRLFKVAGRVSLFWPVLRPWLPPFTAWLRDRSRSEQ
jgi:YqjK-like protein